MSLTADQTQKLFEAQLKAINDQAEREARQSEELHAAKLAAIGLQNDGSALAEEEEEDDEGEDGRKDNNEVLDAEMEQPAKHRVVLLLEETQRISALLLEAKLNESPNVMLLAGGRSFHQLAVVQMYMAEAAAKMADHVWEIAQRCLKYMDVLDKRDANPVSRGHYLDYIKSQHDMISLDGSKEWMEDENFRSHLEEWIKEGRTGKHWRYMEQMLEKWGPYS